MATNLIHDIAIQKGIAISEVRKTYQNIKSKLLKQHGGESNIVEVTKCDLAKFYDYAAIEEDFIQNSVVPTYMQSVSDASSSLGWCRVNTQQSGLTEDFLTRANAFLCETTGAEFEKEITQDAAKDAAVDGKLSKDAQAKEDAIAKETKAKWDGIAATPTMQIFNAVTSVAGFSASKNYGDWLENNVGLLGKLINIGIKHFKKEKVAADVIEPEEVATQPSATNDAEATPLGLPNHAEATPLGLPNHDDVASTEQPDPEDVVSTDDAEQELNTIYRPLKELPNKNADQKALPYSGEFSLVTGGENGEPVEVDQKAVTLVQPPALNPNEALIHKINRVELTTNGVIVDYTESSGREVNDFWVQGTGDADLSKFETPQQLTEYIVSQVVANIQQGGAGGNRPRKAVDAEVTEESLTNAAINGLTEWLHKTKVWNRKVANA